MPRYEVTVQGRGLALPLEGAVAVAFLRVVQVRAADPLAAQVSAVERVRSEWGSSILAWRNRGEPPNLTVFRIGLLSWWHRLFGSPKGYIFFGEDGVRIPDPPQRGA